MLTKEQVTQVLESAQPDSLPEYALDFLEGDHDLSEEVTAKCVELAEGIVRARPDLNINNWPDTIPPV